MRKPAIILVILGLLFLGLTVINAATVELPVTEVREPVLAATASVQYLTDNSLNTVWEADGSQTARAELNLAETALIEGIQLYGEYQGNLVIEYWDNAGWHSFMASYLKSPPAPDWNLIDLSYDQVRTDRIRLTLVNPGNLQKLGGIKEIKVLGQPVTTILQRLEPAEVIGNSRTDKNFPAELLFDRNTYTAWQVTAGTTPAEAVVDLGTTCTLKYIKFFSKSAVNQYRLEYDQNGQWRVLTGEGITTVPDCPSGWRRINLEHYEINTARLRLVLPGYSALSGPGEVEIWGYREQGDVDQPYLYLDSGLISLRPEAPLNYAFSLKQRPGAALLHLVTIGEPSTLSWELDGQAQGELQPVLEKAGKRLYQQLIFADQLGAGEHFLRIRGAAGSLIDCRLELLKEQPLPNTALTDRWTLTPGRGGTTLINFQKNLQIDELNVKYLGIPSIQLEVEQGDSWRTIGAVSTYRSGATGGEAVYANPGFVSQIRVTGNTNLTEVKVNGSPVNDGAPQVKIFTPIAGTVINPQQLPDLKLEGWVDQPEATITVNGLKAVLQGHHWEMPLRELDLNLDGANQVTVTATDRSGRSGEAHVRFFVGNLPKFTLDLADGIIYTKETQIKVSGRLEQSNCKVTVNGKTVADDLRSFATDVVLTEGLNLIQVTVVNKNNPQLVSCQTRKVVRCSQPPRIQLFEPVDGQTVNTETVQVIGQVNSLTPVALTLNGQAVTLQGNRFNATALLGDGANRIVLQAVDRVGQKASLELTVIKVAVAPNAGIVINQPMEGAFLNNQIVTVSGNLNPGLEDLVINGQAVNLNNRRFSMKLELAEGAGEIVAQARTDGGQTVRLTRKVVIDTQPPEVFKPTVEFVRKNNAEIPQLNFATTDTGSGISHYEVAINGGTWQSGVVSPYQLPVPLPQPENIIEVKVVDRAGNSRVAEVKLASDGAESAQAFALEAIPAIRRVVLEWEDAKTDAVYYRIKRIPSFNNGEDRIVDPKLLKENRFVDREVVDNTEYSYTVEAINQNGNKVASASATLTAGFALEPVSPSGRKVRFDDCTVEISQNAIDENLQFMASEAEAQLPENQFAKPVGPVYSFKLLNAGQSRQQMRQIRRQGKSRHLGELKRRFRRPVYLRIKYADFVLPQGVTPEQLSIYWYNEGNQAWERLTRVQNNLHDQILSVPLEHFSEYQVMAAEDPAPELDRYYELGVSNYRPYFQNNFELISTFSGSLTVVTTDLAIPGRSGLDLLIKRIYDSNAAELEQRERIKAPLDTFGYGWSLSIPWIETIDTGTFLKLPDGKRVKVNFTDNNFEYHEGVHLILQKTTDKHILTLKEGIKYEFDLDGRPIKQYDITGKNCIEFQYNSDNKRQLSKIVDLSSVVSGVATRSINFTYNKVDGTDYQYITQISTGTTKVRTWQYAYNSSGLLSEVQEPATGNSAFTRKTTYSYTTIDVEMGRKDSYTGGSTPTTYKLNFLTGIKYPTGEISGYSVQAKKWSEKVDDPRPNMTYYTYWQYGYRVFYEKHTVADRTVSYEYTGNSKSGSLERGNFIPPNTNIISCKITEEGRTTIDQFKHVVGNDLVDGKDAKYNSQGALLVSRQIFNNDREYEKIEYDYNIPLRAVSSQRHYRNNTLVVQISNHYDDWGNLTDRTDSCRNLKESWTYYTHDTIKNLVNTAVVKHAHPLSGKNTVVTTNYQYDAALGKPTQITVNDGSREVITKYFYDDSNGNLVKTVQYSGDANELVTEYSYDPQSNFTYPLTKKLLKIRRVDGTSSDIVTEYNHNPETGLKEWEKDPLGYVTRYEYDALNRLIKVTLPDDDSDDTNNPFREYVFNDTENYCDYYNEKRQRTRFVFDPLSRLKAVIKYTKGTRYPAEIKTVYNYDNLGRITSIVDPRGTATPEVANDYTTWYEYDGLNRVTKVTLPDDTPDNLSDNPYTILSYDDVTNTVTMIDELGGKVVERRDWAGRLVESTQYCSFNNATQVYKWQFVYDAIGKRVRQIDPNNALTDQEYDAFGRLVKLILPEVLVVRPGTIQPVADRPVTTSEYDLAGNKRVEISPNGTKTEYEYDQIGRLIKTIVFTKDGIRVNQAFYDAAGNKVKTIDANGKVRTYTYSARGNLLSETDPLGRTTRYRYDVIGNRIAVIDPRNSGAAPLVWYYRNSDGSYGEQDPRTNKTFTTWYLYDELNQLYRTVLPDQTPPANPYAATVDYDNPYLETEYDSVGNKIKVRDANGVTVSYTYTATNRVRQEIDGLGRVQKEYTYDKKGNPVTVKDIMGRVTTNQYDSLGRLRVMIDPSGNKQTLEYDWLGNKVRTTDARGNLMQFNYDALGRLTSVRDSLAHLTQYQYDPNGNRVTVIAPNNLVTRYKYDESNRLVELQDSLGNITSYRYDTMGNLIGKKDPRGSDWTYQYYDNYALKRMDVKGTDNSGYWVDYQYDEVGNCQQISDSENHTIKYNYNGSTYIADPLNRVNQISRSFDGKTYQTAYRYDQAGQLTGILYPEATAWLEYKYNNLNQLSEVVGFTAAQNGIVYNNDGSLKTLTYANGVSTAYSYESGGRLDQIVTKLGNSEILKLDYEYDPNGNITRLNDQTFQYDPVNQLIRAYNPEQTIDEQPSQVKVGIFVNDPLGQGSLNFGANQQAVFKLDYASSSVGLDLGSSGNAVKKILLVPGDEYLNHRVDANALELFVSADNMVYTPFNRSDWEYSKNNGVITLTFKQAIKLRYLKIHVKIDDRDQLFQPVDKATFLNELAKTVQVYQEVTGRTEEYQYDAAGNRMLLKVTLSQTNQYNSRYYPNSDRLMTDGKYAFAYDAAGNLIQKGNKFTISGNTVSFTTKGTGVEYWEYSYDLLNRLIKVTKNGTIASEYQYDPTGLRVVKKAKGQTTHYVFEGTEPIFEKNITTNKVKSYIYAFGKHLARVDGKIGDSSAKKYFYHTDQLGSVKAITDQNGQIVKKNDYYAFGSQFNQEGSLDETHGFTGKEYDADIGLYYYNARWYDPELGRFISEDPAADPNNPNLYSYCGNNPTCRIDPSGESFLGALLIGALIGGASAGIAGGDGDDILRGALLGLVSGGVGAAVSGAIGPIVSGTLGTVMTGAVVGGVTSGLMNFITGGDFVNGFTIGILSGGFSGYLNNQFRDFANKGWFCAGITSGSIEFINSAIAGGGSFQDFALGFVDGVANYSKQYISKRKSLAAKDNTETISFKSRSAIDDVTVLKDLGIEVNGDDVIIEKTQIVDDKGVVTTILKIRVVDEMAVWSFAVDNSEKSYTGKTIITGSYDLPTNSVAIELEAIIKKTGTVIASANIGVENKPIILVYGRMDGDWGNYSVDRTSRLESVNRVWRNFSWNTTVSKNTILEVGATWRPNDEILSNWAGSDKTYIKVNFSRYIE